MTTLIRGITLQHPWAFCISHLGKDVENRTWRPERQGGSIGMYLAIHGGAMPTGAKLQDAISDAAYVMQNILTPDYVHFNVPTPMLHRCTAALQEGGEQAFFTPGIVAVARLAGVTTDSISPWKASGQYQWELADVVALPEAVRHRGAQGLFTLNPQALISVRQQYMAARQGKDNDPYK